MTASAPFPSPEDDAEAAAKLAAIEAGIASADAGRLVPHEAVRRWLLDLAEGRRTPRPRSPCG